MQVTCFYGQHINILAIRPVTSYFCNDFVVTSESYATLILVWKTEETGNYMTSKLFWLLNILFVLVYNIFLLDERIREGCKSNILVLNVKELGTTD